MDFPQLCSGFYTMFSSKAEIESCRNFRLEKIESGQGRNQYAMYKNYGLKVFGSDFAVPASVCRGLLLDPTNTHLFDIQGGTVYDRLSDGSQNPAVSPYAPIVDDGQVCAMDESSNSLFIVSANILYRINSGALTAPATDFTPGDVGVIEGLIVATAVGTNSFYFSTDDGATWPALNVQSAEASPNVLIGLVIDHVELWLFGSRRTQVFTVGSNPNAPFDQVQSGVIEMGLAAPRAKAKLDNSIFWLGRNRDGEHQVWRANGYSPVRVSNNAVESAIRSYPSIDDAVMQSYTLASPCIRLTFPSANDGLGATWEYDVAVNQWYEVAWWNPALTRYEAHRGNCYVSAFGGIIVGDRSNGYLYEMNEDFYTDFGYPLRAERRTPHSTRDGKRIQYKRFDVYLQPGVGLTTPVWWNDHSIDPVTFAAAVAALVPGTITQAQADVMTAIYAYVPYDQDLAMPPAGTAQSPGVMETLGFYDAGKNPMIAMRYSKDGGETYTPYRQRAIGRAGTYNARTFWGGIGGLGMDRDRVWEISTDSPNKIAVIQGSFEAVLCST